MSISIHAPSRERLTGSGSSSESATFQSTLPRGSDILQSWLGFPHKDFNPRSLAGATLTQAAMNGLVEAFQSTLPRGSDKHSLCIVRTAVQFQSTLPRGSDFDRIGLTKSRYYFNPRSLAGATKATNIILALQLFQSTLPRGSDSKGRKVCKACVVFQSTLPRGSDCGSVFLADKHNKFQSTLPRGSDARTMMTSRHRLISIHAPSRERLLAV